MENMELNQATETAIETIATETGNNGGKLIKNLGIGGGIVVGSILLWETAVKPLAKKVKDRKAKKTQAKLAKAKNANPDPDEEDVFDTDDIPEI